LFDIESQFFYHGIKGHWPVYRAHVSDTVKLLAFVSPLFGTRFSTISLT